ncbi:MAG: DUF2891 domain-containing protein [Planctomycetes bacterium]|jgi:hypothetical protein|nr:DUF2891 domain-containing protein [Planctomycetota bacterium]
MAGPPGSAPHPPGPSLDAIVASRLAGLALDCIGREYPNQVAHVLHSDGDARPPRELHPIFFGCYDWHSAVHAHWTLARLTRLFPDGSFADRARTVLADAFTPEKVAAELAYLEAEGRTGFERPYGLAWLLALAEELTRRPEARPWAEALRPLAGEAAARLASYFAKLTAPVRTGEHGQTAFALALALDAARAEAGGDADALAAEARRLFLGDRDWPLRFEPSGTDFLSPGLAEADLLRRVLPPEDFARWLSDFLPEIDLAPVTPPDRADGKFAHLDGLNLSRALMLHGIAAGLPPSDPRHPALRPLAEAHAAAALPAVAGPHYAGAHWLATFATLFLTSRVNP